MSLFINKLSYFLTCTKSLLVNLNNNIILLTKVIFKPSPNMLGSIILGLLHLIRQELFVLFMDLDNIPEGFILSLIILLKRILKFFWLTLEDLDTQVLPEDAQQFKTFKMTSFYY